MFVMVSYDVPAKRTEIYKKMLKEFLVHEQASVFMGDLPESEIVRLMAKISERIGLRRPGTEARLQKSAQRGGPETQQGCSRRANASGRRQVAWKELVHPLMACICA